MTNLLITFPDPPKLFHMTPPDEDEVEEFGAKPNRSTNGSVFPNLPGEIRTWERCGVTGAQYRSNKIIDACLTIRLRLPSVFDLVWFCRE